MIALLSGAVAMASLVAAMLFLRFWRRTGDRLFFFFCLAFFVDAAVRVGLALLPVRAEHEAFVYLLRLATFALIVLAIVDKNRRQR